MKIDYVNLTPEEIDACVELVAKMREEARKKKAYQDALEGFRSSVQSLVDVVGLAVAKRIIRETNRELREL